jgi:hypothetical protein
MNANLEHLDSPDALSGRLPAMTSGFVSNKGAFALAHILIVLPKTILTQVKTQRRGAGIIIKFSQVVALDTPKGNAADSCCWQTCCSS